MKLFFLVFHIVVTVLLSACILLQNSKGGLGSAFGGGEFYRTRRGAEKVVFTATILLSVVFLVTSIANLIIH